ncbi:GNAT family N-acetyltransferase [Sphingomonas sp. CGMCC 1.13654]|uniref:GNAT family N-acetyltransferase n=1 Tax=Sphingomonas chungangi TaxID=2683589 RepID=A0A838LD60_9SPHN|nr:GNAT family N-acetyltransferase [Sphingomonas chungangi]MBA2936066.1 GNAT family N-acetyltransferase [Sphingomonas chungangi]MVW55455.1 GNAT family N-acetyltransferase [Sphingomonas chungangi]
MLETERLTIRRITLGDTAFMIETLNDPGFLANIGDRGVRTIEEAETYIRDRILASYEANGFGMFRVALKDSDEGIGTVGFVSREGLDGPDLGFAFLAAHTGKGYGYEAANALLDWGREVLSLPPLLAITAPENVASAALLVKLGFREEGRITLPTHGGESRLFVQG